MRPEAQYDEPFFWWGPRWDVTERFGLRELLRDGTIDLWHGAHVWASIARGYSLAVVAGPSGVGKSTLLAALCELLPPGTRRIYIRGCFEDFSFLRDPNVDPALTALLVNEVSPHLPVYLWGSGVAEVMRATRQGYMVLATAHAASGLEFVGLLAGPPLRLPPELIAAFGVVVGMGYGDPAKPATPARITGAWRLGETRDGVSVDALPEAPRDISRESMNDSWFPGAEIAERMHRLVEFREGSEPAPPAVRILTHEDDAECRQGGGVP